MDIQPLPTGLSYRYKEKAGRKIGFLSQPTMIHNGLVKLERERYSTACSTYSTALLYLQCSDCTVQPPHVNNVCRVQGA